MASPSVSFFVGRRMISPHAIALTEPEFVTPVGGRASMAKVAAIGAAEKR